MKYEKKILKGQANFTAGLIDNQIKVTLITNEFGKMEMNLDIVKILDKITDLIPGHMDDTFLDPLISNLVRMKSSKS